MGASDHFSLSHLDGDFEAMTAHRKGAGKGKADIGGRLRVATILKRAGIASPAPPERIAGATNEVWRSGDFIVRVGDQVGVNRLRREAQLANFLPWDVRYPPVAACGVEPFGEWVIVRNRPGIPMSEAWSSLDRSERRSLTHEFAKAVKAVHGTRISPDEQALLAFDDATAEGLPHQLPVERLMATLGKASEMPFVDAGLIADLIDKLESVAGAFDGPGEDLIHGDLHFENVLVRDGRLVTVLDFEWSRIGHKEFDLDILARFCAHPDLSVGGDYDIDRDDYRPVLGWFSEAYPELFSAPNLIDRLMLCALAYEIPWLVRMPPPGPAGDLSPFHPINRLKDLLVFGSEAERLGWMTTGI